MTFSFNDLESEMARIDAALRPIAKQKIDLNNPDWMTEMTQGPAPVDRAGVRDASEALLKRIVREYPLADADGRSAIRGLFRKYESFAWGATLPGDAKTEAGFRARLILFSIQDQEKDPRDAKLWLDDLLKDARDAGVEGAAILRAVAALCGEDDPYGWGSTRQWLMDAAERFTV